MLLVKKCHFFLELDLVKIRLEIILSDFGEKKETCFDYKNKIFKRLKNHIFSKGLTHAFRQKMEFFSGFVFGQKRTIEIRFNDILDRTENFFKYKNKIFQSPKISVFQRG